MQDLTSRILNYGFSLICGDREIFYNNVSLLNYW